MTITAKFASTCPECDKPIAVGDSIEWQKGQKAKHTACAKRYYEIAVGGDKIGLFAHTFAEAKAEAERRVAVGCDAEYCDEYDGSFGQGACKKEHYHTVNCRCHECIENDLADDY